MRIGKRAQSGKGILIAVVLGPLCAAAADLPGRAVATPAEPVAVLGIQSFEHAKVARGDVATVSKTGAVRRQQHSRGTVLAHIDVPNSATRLAVASTRLADFAHDPARLQWLENPTSTGP